MLCAPPHLCPNGHCREAVPSLSLSCVRVSVRVLCFKHGADTAEVPGAKVTGGPSHPSPLRSALSSYKSTLSTLMDRHRRLMTSWKIPKTISDFLVWKIWSPHS